MCVLFIWHYFTFIWTLPYITVLNVKLSLLKLNDNGLLPAREKRFSVMHHLIIYRIPYHENMARQNPADYHIAFFSILGQQLKGSISALNSYSIIKICHGVRHVMKTCPRPFLCFSAKINTEFKSQGAYSIWRERMCMYVGGGVKFEWLLWLVDWLVEYFYQRGARKK